MTSWTTPDLCDAHHPRPGWSGLVIHGAVRDVEVLRELDLGVPVTFGGVTVRSGQWVHADASGVLVSDVSLV